MEYIVWSRVRTFVYEYRDQFIALLFTIGVVVTSIIVVADVMAVTPTTGFESHEFPLAAQPENRFHATGKIDLVPGYRLVNATLSPQGSSGRYAVSLTSRPLREDETPDSYMLERVEFIHDEKTRRLWCETWFYPIIVIVEHPKQHQEGK